MLFIYLSALETDDEKRKIAEIYTEYYSRYMYVAMKVLGNKSLAEDAVHMAFVEIISRRKKLLAMEPIDFLRYTYSIVQNKAHDIIRKNRKYVDFDCDEEKNIVDEHLPTDDFVELKIDAERLSYIIEKLNETEQRVLISKYILDKSYAEIAAELGWTVKNVEVRLYRIRNKMQKMIKTEGITL